MKNISRREALKYLGASALGLVAVTGVMPRFSYGQKVSKLAVDVRKNIKTGEKISLLGFGCMRFPLTADKKIDEELSMKMIDYAYSHGVNYYDTAWPYHGGNSEVFIGKALQKYPRESFYLADKMPTWEVKNIDSAKKIFATQLEKCRVKYFDYYLLHALSKKEDYERVYEQYGVYEYLMREKAAGRIKRLGFSFHGDKELFDYLISKHDWDFVQIQLNYYDWDIEDAKYYYKCLEDKKIPCIVMEPIRGGMLATLSPDSAAVLKKVHPDWSLASWALRYVASLPGVLTVLSGMSAMEHVTDNVKTMTSFTPLTLKERETVGEALRVFLKTKPIRCTTCKYCMPCPFGVDIPANFALYNKCVNEGKIPDTDHPEGAEYKKRRNAFLNEYRHIPDEAKADRCRKCGKCVPKCPQHLPIIQELERISQISKSL